MMDVLSRKVFIGDIFKVSSGGTPNRKKQEYFFGGHIPWVKTGELKGKFANNPSEFITQLGLDNSSAKLFPPKTVLLAMYGATIGACSILGFEAATNQACAAILPTDACNELYLYYYLSSIKPSLVNKGVGGAQPNISAGLIKKIKIPLPPLAEQKKIAAILDAADRLRQKDQQLIAKYNELSQSLFLDMFGDPVTNPMGWKKIRFDSLVADECPLTYGIVQPGDEFDEGTPVVRPVDLLTRNILVKSLKRIDPSISQKFQRTILQGGEILLSVRGSVGAASFASSELAGVNVTRGIVPIWMNKKKMTHEFAFDLIQSEGIQREIKRLSKGATLIQINLKDLREMCFIMPPLTLQNQFAERIQHIEDQKQQAQAALQKSDDLFHSLLQRAFKGELTA